MVSDFTACLYCRTSPLFRRDSSTGVDKLYHQLIGKESENCQYMASSSMREEKSYQRSVSLNDTNIKFILKNIVILLIIITNEMK